MDDESTCKAEGFRVTVKARMYHGVLHETMTRLGKSRKEMAEYLGISYIRFSEMLRMNRVPKFNDERGKRLKQDLEDLTGMSISELFPEHVFTNEFLGRDKTIEVTREVPFHLLESAGMVHQLSLPPDEKMMQKEETGQDLGNILDPVLNALTERQRLVIKLRFFEGKTYRECMPLLNVRFPQGVAAIEKSVLSKLREPMHKRMLMELTNNGHLLSSAEAEFNRWLIQAIKTHANVPEAKPC